MATLGTVREAWEKQLLLFHSLISYMHDTQDSIKQMAPSIQSLPKVQQQVCNMPAQPQDFYLGHQVLCVGAVGIRHQEDKIRQD